MLLPQGQNKGRSLGLERQFDKSMEQHKKESDQTVH